MNNHFCLFSTLFRFTGCGQQLRKDDPTALKEIILLVQQKAAASSSSSSGQPIRIRFMLDMIYDLKNNKKRHTDQAALFAHLRNWLKSTTGRSSSSGSSPSDRALRITYSDMRDAATKGRWWLVGSAWQQSNAADASMDPSQAKLIKEAASSGDANLLALAREQRMNTDFRRAVFCIVMGAEDFADALAKLMKLHIKGSQDREIARIIMHCCRQEKRYNAYYAMLADKLCKLNRRYRFTFQLAFWDYYKRLDQDDAEITVRQLYNIAQMLSELLRLGALSVSVLKAIDFGEVGAQATLFLHTLLSGIMVHETLSNQDVVNIFAPCVQKSDLEGLRSGIVHFFKHHLVKLLKAQAKRDQMKLQAKTMTTEAFHKEKESRKLWRRRMAIVQAVLVPDAE
jgi:nucleolar MIF4G domain-containing protein 1